MSNNIFEERLKRISEQNGAPEPQAAIPGGDFAPPPPRRRKHSGGIGGGLIVIMCLAGLLLLAIPGYYVLHLSNGIVSQMGVVTGTHTPTVDGPPRKKEAGLLDRIMASISGSSSAVLPIEALPPASPGWLRATTDDAEQGDLVARMTEAWPRNPGGVSRPIDQNMGYKRLQSFAKLYRTSDIETRTRAKSQAIALYMASSGEFLNVAIKYRSSRNALGDPINRFVWGDTLEDIARDKLEKNEVIERTSLAGFEVINRTQPAGTSLIARPIEQSRRQPTGMKLLVPLTNRSFIELQGIATPAEVEKILAAIDVSQLPGAGK